MLRRLSRCPLQAGWALSLLVLAPGACAPPPPGALSGLWGVGEGSCAQGRGVTFEADRIRVHLTDGPATLLDGVRYEAAPKDGGLLLRVRHRLPEKAGGASAVGGVGVIALHLGSDGWLRPLGQRFEDVITGSARMPLRPAAYVQMLTLRACDGPWPARQKWQDAAAAPPKPVAIRGRDPKAGAPL
jgi:hypothetical protein